MTYTEHPVTRELLAVLWVDLWARGKEELARWGLSPEQGFAEFLGYAEKSERSGILCADGKPVLVAGICKDGDGAFTFMQATNDFEAHALPIMRVMRRNSKHVGDLFIYSVCVHPKTERFFAAIGFQKDPEWISKTTAGWPMYRFRRM